jgi:fructokinase
MVCKGMAFAGVPGLLARHVFSDVVRSPVVPKKHGDSSGVRGAAWLWPAHGRGG